MLNKSFQVFFKGTGLFILILLFHFKINAQNFNETDGRNANTIAVESSQGESKKNTQQSKKHQKKPTRPHRPRIIEKYRDV